MTLYIGNSFSLSMIPAWRWDRDESGPAFGADIRVTPVDPLSIIATARWQKEDIVSCVGHADTARLFSKILRYDVPVNRQSVTLTDEDEDRLLVGQYSGPRLPEGATELPDGASIRWLVVRIRAI